MIEDMHLIFYWNLCSEEIGKGSHDAGWRQISFEIVIFANKQESEMGSLRLKDKLM